MHLSQLVYRCPIETSYLSKKGITRTGYSIDRKDNEMGYFLENIRTVPATVNNKKRQRSLTYEYIDGIGMVATLTNNYNDKIVVVVVANGSKLD